MRPVHERSGQTGVGGAGAGRKVHSAMTGFHEVRLAKFARRQPGDLAQAAAAVRFGPGAEEPSFPQGPARDAPRRLERTSLTRRDLRARYQLAPQSDAAPAQESRAGRPLVTSRPTRSPMRMWLAPISAHSIFQVTSCGMIKAPRPSPGAGRDSKSRNGCRAMISRPSEPASPRTRRAYRACRRWRWPAS